MSIFSELFHKPSKQEDEEKEIFSQFSKESLLQATPEELSRNREKLYDMFSSNTWNSLDYDKKCQAVQALENDFAFQQGRPAKEVSVEPLRNGLYGGWSAKEDKIVLNENLVKNGSLYDDEYAVSMPDANMQIFDTVAHEGYHAYQSYALEHPNVHSDKKQLREWALNEGKYYGKGDQYLIQPQERDAWNYGHQATTAAFREIEARNGLEPGRPEYENSAAMSSYQNALQREQTRDPKILQHMEQEMEKACISKKIKYEFEQNTQTAETPRPSKEQDEESQDFIIENDGLGNANSTPEMEEPEDYLGSAQTPELDVSADDEYLGSVCLDEDEQEEDAGMDETIEIL